MSLETARRSAWLCRLLLGLLAGGALLCIVAGVRRFSDAFDEGYALYGAARILDGEVPYRDFWLVYAPAQFYVLAGIFKLFGPSILAGRIYDVIIRFAIVALLYRITARLATPAVALVPALIATVWLGYIDYYAYALYPALALTFAGVLCLLHSFESPGRLHLVLGGLAMGGATLFRHDFGFYAVASATLVLATLGWQRPSADLRARWRSLWRALGPFVVGVAIPVVPVLLAFLAVVPASELWFDLVAFPAVVINKYRMLPFPPLPAPGMPRADLRTSVLFYVPVLVFACALIRSLAKRGEPGPALLALLGFGFFRQAFNRADEVHMLSATLVAGVLTPVLLFALARSGRSRVAGVAAVVIAVAAGDAYLLGPAQGLATIAGQDSPSYRHYTLERGRGIQSLPDQEMAIRYIQARTSKTDSIFVGSSRHDQLIVNDILFYFLADRRCATRYHDLCPGVATTLPVQQEIVSDLESRRVEFVVICVRWHNIVEPNESGRSSGVTLLDEYIQRHFRPVANFGYYIVGQRVAWQSGSAAPPGRRDAPSTLPGSDAELGRRNEDQSTLIRR